MLAKLGKYVIKSELGRGAMGVVYWAEDPRLGRAVALKTMSPSVAGDPELLQRFYREAQSAGKLRHPNIVTIYDIDEADGTPFIAMEFLEGETLEKIIAARKDLPVVKKLDIVMQTCRALHYAHQHGIIHRDVKPANVVVLTDGLVKIVDFGIARVTGGSMTRTGLVMGTPMYMSPEQVLGQPVDARSDIFSVGVILYELLTYQNPFAAPDIPSILYKISERGAPPLSTALPGCPPQLEKVVMRALARNPEDRSQSAADLAFELQQVADYLKRHMVEVYLEQGRRSIEAGNLTIAKESLQKALEIDSNHDLAKSLLGQVQDEIHNRQLAQKTEQLLRQAKEALQEAHYDEALSALDKILRLDPKHEEALRYKQFATERADRSRKINRHMGRAEKLVADADLQGAKTELEAILALDPQHARAQEMLHSIATELAEQERMRQVRQDTQGARAYLAEKNFSKALELLERAIQLDPLNIEVESLIRLVRSGQDKEERRKLLEQRLATIHEALNREQFEQAVGLAEEALREFPDHSEVVKLHARANRFAEAQKKRRSVEDSIQAVRGLLQKNEFSAATALLERALQTTPDEARLLSCLKTVREAEEQARKENLRREAMREADELIRNKEFVAAGNALEKALGSVGHSPELIDLLEFVREQQIESQRQEQIQHLLSRAQTFIREENFEEAASLLERGQSKLQAGEIDALLATAREQLQNFGKQREETLKRAQQFLHQDEAGKAVALLEASPKAYFKNEKFQQIYAQAREGFRRSLFIRSTVEQVGQSIAREDLAEAETLLKKALQTYPNDPSLQASRQRLHEERMRLRRASWTKLLDEARINIGQMKYQSAIDLLRSVDWQSIEMPDLAREAARLLEEARRREEVAAAQTVVRVGPPLPVSEGSGLVSAQERLRAALESSTSQRAPRAPASPPAVAPPPAPVVMPSPPETTSAAGPPPTPRPPVPPATRAAPVPPTAVVTPAVVGAPAVTVPTPRPEKRAPVVLWVGVGVIVLALAAVGAWRLLISGRATPGYAQLTAVPWAEVVSVQTKEGKNLNIRGTTPLSLELSPGEYVFELKSEQVVQKVTVVVKSGQVSQAHFATPGVNVHAMVDELLSQY
jgi:serine/threonine protein kinase